MTCAIICDAIWEIFFGDVKMKFLWKYLKKYIAMYSVGIVILFGVDLLSLYIPQLTGYVADGLGTEGYAQSDLWRHVLLILLIGAGMALGRFGWRFFIFGSARKVQMNLRNSLFDHLSTLSCDYYNHNKTGDLMAHFTSDIEAVRMAIGPSVISCFDAIVMTIMVVIKMVVYVDYRLTLAACIPMVLILAGAVFYCMEADKRYREKQEAFSKLTDEAQESISGIRVIKAFVQERKEIKSFARSNQLNKDKNLRVVRFNVLFMSMLDFLIGISSAITLFYGGSLVLKGEISLGMFVAFNQYVGMLVWPMIAAGDSASMISQGMASLKRIKKIMDTEPDITDDKADASITELKGHIEFKNLSFAYAPETPEVIKEITADLKEGSTIAIMGKTGSGKTTIADLLLRMYNVESGSILIDGHSIETIPLEVLRKQVAYVPQENFLFSDTIQTNVAFGVRELVDIPEEREKVKVFGEKSAFREGVGAMNGDKVSVADKLYNDLEPVQEACRKAVIHDNIMDFPGQYSTLVGERGVTMSGGQKQRSSIARSLMKNAPILILDDALSAVDTDTEEQILGNLKEDRKGKTTIIIAHRISTTQNADKIMFLENGRLKEFGSHEELIRFGGLYCRLYEKQQLEKQIEDEGRED